MPLHVELDVNYADDDKIVAAGEKAELLYVRSLCYAKRLMTDGFVADAQLPRFLLSGVNQRARTLVEVGLWSRDDERKGFVITSWLRRNRTAQEIRAIAEAKQAGGREGNHNRWHRKGRVAGCEWCESAGVPPPNDTTDRSTDRTSDRGSESFSDSHSESDGERSDRSSDRDPADEQARQPTRASQFPNGWTPTANHRVLASQRSLDVDAEAEQFEDHNRAKGTKYKDWDRAFNTWLRNSDRFASPTRTLRVVNGSEPPRPRDVPDTAVFMEGTWVY